MKGGRVHLLHWGNSLLDEGFFCLHPDDWVLRFLVLRIAIGNISFRLADALMGLMFLEQMELDLLVQLTVYPETRDHPEFALMVLMLIDHIERNTLLLTAFGSIRAFYKDFTKAKSFKS